MGKKILQIYAEHFCLSIPMLMGCSTWLDKQHMDVSLCVPIINFKRKVLVPGDCFIIASSAKYVDELHCAALYLGFCICQKFPFVIDFILHLFCK